MPSPIIALPPLRHQFRELILEGLREDGFSLDWTSMGLSTGRTRNRKGGSRVKAQIIAKEDGVFYGEQIFSAAAALSVELGQDFRSRARVVDGSRVKSAQLLAEWEGDARGVLALERVALNLSGYLSGIATRTHRLVDLVESEWKKNKWPGSPTRITSTRKILPHYRDVSIAAVMAGGGYSHRVNLSGGVLIKENHIASAGGIREAIRLVRATAPHGLKIEIEVTQLKELKQALEERAEIVLLDNFRPEEVRSALDWIKKSKYEPQVECSGGINESTLVEYAIPGVDIVSIGGLTHSVKTLDLSLRVK